MSFQRKTKRRMRQATAIALAAAVTVPAASLVATSEVEAAKQPFTFEFQEIEGASVKGTKEILITLDRNLRDGSGPDGKAINTNLIEVTFPAKATIMEVIDDNQLRVQINNINPMVDEYELTFKQGALQYEGQNRNQFQDYVIPFAPRDLAPGFRSIFIDSDPREINERIFNQNTSPQVRLNSPGSQVTQMLVRHRQAQGQTITDIDIEAVQPNVTRITADIYDGQGLETGLGIDQNKEFIRLEGEDTFKATFAGLEGVADGRHEIRIRSYDATGRMVESKIEKIGVGGEPKTYDVPNIDTSLDELLNDGDQLDQLLASLTQSRWNNIKVTYPNHRNIAKVNSANAFVTELSKQFVDTVHLTSGFNTNGQTLEIGKASNGGTPTIYIDGNGQTIEGNVMLGFNAFTNMNIYLRNVNITGNLDINVGPNGKAFIDNVNTSGNYQVLSGGTSSVEINDSTGAKMVFANNTPVRVSLKGTTTFNGTDINSNRVVTLDDQTTAATSFGNVDVKTEEADVTLRRGNYDQVIMNGVNSTLRIHNGVRVDTVVGNVDYNLAAPSSAITKDYNETKKSGVTITDNLTPPSGAESEVTAEFALAASISTGGTSILQHSLRENGVNIRIDIDGDVKWPAANSQGKITGQAETDILAAITGGSKADATVTRNRDDRITVHIPANSTHTAVDFVINRGTLATVINQGTLTTTGDQTITVTPSIDLDTITLDGGLLIGGIGFVGVDSSNEELLEYQINNGTWHKANNLDPLDNLEDGNTITIREINQPNNKKEFRTVYNNTAWVGGTGATVSLKDLETETDITEIILIADDGDSAADVTVTFDRLVNIDFGGFTFAGDIEINSTQQGAMLFTGDEENRVIAGQNLDGDITVDTPNATVTNEITVAGTITVNGIEQNTWYENAGGDGNNIVFAADGARIVLNGQVKELEVTAENARVEIANTATVTDLKATGSGSARIIGAANKIVALSEGADKFTMPSGVRLNRDVQDAIDEAATSSAIDLLPSEGETITIASIEIAGGDEAETADKVAAVKSHLEAIEGMAALGVKIAVEHKENGTFTVTFSKGTSEEAVEVTVTAFVTPEDVKAVADAIGKLPTDPIASIDVADGNDAEPAAKAAAVKSYLDDIEGMDDLGVTIEVEFNEDSGEFDVTISKDGAKDEGSVTVTDFVAPAPAED